MKRVYIECECSDAAHVIRLTADPEDEFSPLWLDVHLNQYHTIWQRVRLAAKYVFGYQSKFGAYDSILIGPEDARRIVETIEEVYKCH